MVNWPDARFAVFFCRGSNRDRRRFSSWWCFVLSFVLRTSASISQGGLRGGVGDGIWIMFNGAMEGLEILVNKVVQIFFFLSLVLVLLQKCILMDASLDNWLLLEVLSIKESKDICASDWKIRNEANCLNDFINIRLLSVFYFL